MIQNIYQENGYLLHLLSTAVRQQQRQFLMDSGITDAWSWYINFLYANQDKTVTQRTLEEHFQVSAPTVSNILTKMEREGLLRREQGAADRRMRTLTLTEKGRSLYAVQMQSVEGIERQLVQGMTEEEQRTFRDLILRAMRNMGIRTEAKTETKPCGEGDERCGL